MTKDDFIKSVTELLKDNNRVLALVRIPNSGNNRNYFFLENPNQIGELINESNTSDSITVFKAINELNNGLVTEDFIKTITESQVKDNFEPEFLIVNNTYREYQEKGDSEWNTVENVNELKEVLIDNIGETVTIISEPDFYDEQNTFHLYVPDEYGVSKSGASY
ncbi:hypothetical protein D1816_02660 [Aquimarina sp. AD10]|uniref:hypothetical protein n=1 Tax=Aquimarina sp. AD10 TaxID=1714849 RepID=UPI000E47A017|nr:hypothetical protein [Aquimarina sp. AD10]AXT59292.1 hypothetical protein D1816_02660 [Aquimarina sp. AD10]RKM95201.1 hypothetical protein D7033_17330 [Aquimarina sp. AD10]